jgi:hypothetical protein
LPPLVVLAEVGVLDDPMDGHRMTLTKEGLSVALKNALGGYLFFEADDPDSP